MPCPALSWPTHPTPPCSTQEHLDPEHDPVEGMLGMELLQVGVAGCTRLAGRNDAGTQWSGGGHPENPSRHPGSPFHLPNTPSPPTRRSSLTSTSTSPPPASDCTRLATAWRRRRRRAWWMCLPRCSTKRACCASAPPRPAQVSERSAGTQPGWWGSTLPVRRAHTLLCLLLSPPRSRPPALRGAPGLRRFLLRPQLAGGGAGGAAATRRPVVRHHAAGG